MLRLIKYHTDFESTPVRTPLEDAAQCIGTFRRQPAVVYEPFFSYLSGDLWSVYDAHSHLYSLKHSLSLVECIRFVLRSSSVADRDTIGIYDLSQNHAYTDKKTKHIIVVRPVGTDGLFILLGYVDPTDALHRVQVSFTANGLTVLHQKSFPCH